MASFTVRIELHGADESHYETLHEEMEKEGFTRTIKDKNGAMYHLPDAEYNFSGRQTRQEVLNRAKRAAGKTKLEHAILVTQSDGRTWHGLDPVQD